jgi:hypothetical protein
LKAAAFHGSASGFSSSISAAAGTSVAPNDRVEYLFKQTSLAASGRTGTELQAKSRHKHLTTLGHYVRPHHRRKRPLTARQVS